MAEGRSVADAMKAHRHDQEVWAFAKDLSGVTGGFGELGGSPTSSKSQRLSFKGLGAKVAARMLPDGMKSLAPFGVAVVGQEMKPVSGGPGSTRVVLARRDPGRDSQLARVRQVGLPKHQGPQSRCCASATRSAIPPRPLPETN